MSEQPTLFDVAQFPEQEPLLVEPRPLTDKQKLTRKSKTNPCVEVYGPGPEGTQCQSCALLRCIDFHGKRYYKCGLRGKPTHGAGTDHKLRWPSCVKYQGATKPISVTYVAD